MRRPRCDYDGANAAATCTLRSFVLKLQVPREISATVPARLLPRRARSERQRWAGWRFDKLAQRRGHRAGSEVAFTRGSRCSDVT